MAGEDEILAELRALRAEVRRLKVVALQPRHGVLRLFIKDLETNPRAQYQVHRFGVYYWLLNFPLVVALFFFAPGIWLKVGVFITLVYSVYANLATDYGAMSAALAAMGEDPLPVIPLDDAGR
jgi:hypothetical protein